MKTITAESSALLVVDMQGRLMPAIDDGDGVTARVRRLLDAATLLDVPILLTEQNAKGLGSTIADLNPDSFNVAQKMTFDACRAPDFFTHLPDRPEIVVAGCESHVCVLQTVLGLLDAGKRVYLVRDAIGSRHLENKETAIRRMEKHGAEVVTSEMVIFEWLATAEHPRFRDLVKLVK